jgi:hypothetical protein
MYTAMLGGVGAGRVSSSRTSGPERPPRLIHHRPDFGLVRTRRRSPSRVPRGTPGTQQDAPRGSRSGVITPPLYSSLTPTYLALVTSERLCPRDRGTPKRARHPYPLGRPGPVTLTTTPPARQAATGEADPRATKRSHLVDPGRLDPGPAPARRDRPSETRGGRLGRPMRDYDRKMPNFLPNLNLDHGINLHLRAGPRPVQRHSKLEQ